MDPNASSSLVVENLSPRTVRIESISYVLSGGGEGIVPNAGRQIRGGREVKLTLPPGASRVTVVYRVGDSGGRFGSERKRTATVRSSVTTIEVN